MALVSDVVFLALVFLAWLSAFARGVEEWSGGEARVASPLSDNSTNGPNNEVGAAPSGWPSHYATLRQKMPGHERDHMRTT